LQKQRTSAFGLGIFLIVIVLLFSVGVESETNSGISLDELEQNQYTVTPTTIPLTITSETISPLSEKLSPDTQSVTPEIIEQNNYPGAGYVFPLLQQAFGIGSTVTSLNYNDWDMAGNFNSLSPRMDTTGGANNGNVYVASFSQPIIHRLDPTTNQLTKWTAPIGSYRTDNVLVADSGLVYFNLSHISFSANDYAGVLNPTTNEITLWQLTFADGSRSLSFDETNNVLWMFSLGSHERFYSLDVDTDELKVWDASSICGDGGSLGFAGGAFRAADGLAYATNNQSKRLCTLDPSTNVITSYYAGSLFANSQRPAIDSAGRMYVVDSNADPHLTMIDASVPEAKFWNLSGGNLFSWETAVDLNDDPWFVSRVGSNGIGLVRVDVSTNVVTEWNLNVNPEFASHLTFPSDTKNDMWAVLENAGSGSNDHIAQYCEGACD
jgi:streptogramin lyase